MYVEHKTIIMDMDTEENPQNKLAGINKYFDCLGKINIHQENYFHEDSFINNNEYIKIFHKIKESSIGNPKRVMLFNAEYYIDTVLRNECKYLFKLALKNLQILRKNSTSLSNLTENISDDKLDYYNLRSEITDLLYCIRMLIKDLNENYSNYDMDCYYKELQEALVCFGNELNKFSNLPDHILRHSTSLRGNRCTLAPYHLFHGYLEWRWHYLLTMYELFKHQNVTDNASTNTIFEKYILLFIADLMAIAFKIFDKTQLTDLLEVTPFSCWCVKECWLLLQIFIEELHLKSFWFYVDLVLNKLFDIDSITLEMNDYSTLILCSCKFSSNEINTFGIWLLINIAQVQGFNKTGQYIGYSSDRITSHYIRLESFLKKAITDDISEKTLRIYIILISDIVNKWWQPKNDIFSLLWEYFQKRLNSTFFVPGSSLQSLPVCSNTASGYLNQIKQRLNSTEINYQNSSYNNYLYLLGKHFMRCKSNSEGTHWPKFKGRIYSKLTVNKLLSLTEMGLINLTSLFITLACCIDVQEIGRKLIDLLSQISNEKLDTACKIVIIKAHLSIVILNLENNLDIDYGIKYFIELINGIFTGSTENINSIMCIYAEGLADIIDISQDFHLNEHHLIDLWVPKCLSTCNQNFVSKLMDIFLKLLSKLHTCYRGTFLIGNDTDATHSIFRKVVERLLLHVLPFVKQNATNSIAIIQLSDMAVYFSLFALYDESLYIKFDQNFLILFKYFSQNQNVNIKITRRYLVKICSHHDALDYLQINFQNFECHLIQSWVKCCVLCHDDYKSQEMKELLSIIYDFENFKFLCSYSNLSLLESEDTICTLFVALGLGYSSTTQIQEKSQMRDLLHSYLGLIESHVIPLMKNLTSLDLTLRVYTVIAVLFLHCSKLLYVRSKPSCLLHVLLSQLVLPATLFMDKKPHPYIITAMRKTWYLFFKGLFALNYKTDVYIEKTLKDLIVVYVPFFGITTSSIEKYCTSQPLHKLICAQDTSESLLIFFYEKIYANFLIFRGRQVNPNSSLVLAIFCDIINNSNDFKIIQCFVKNLGTSILEHIMFLDEIAPSKKLAYNILETIIKSSEIDNLKKDFGNSISNLLQKHLAFCSNFIFKLLNKLTDMMPSVLEHSLPEIKNQIAFVEARRGVGHDEGLRKSLRDLELHIKKINKSFKENISVCDLKY